MSHHTLGEFVGASVTWSGCLATTYKDGTGDWWKVLTAPTLTVETSVMLDKLQNWQSLQDLRELPALKELTIRDARVAAGLLFATYLAYWIIGYIRVLLVSNTYMSAPCPCSLQQVRGLPVIHSWIEFFESGARSKLPHIPFFVPVNKYTLDDPFKSKPLAASNFPVRSHADIRIRCSRL